MHQYFFTMFAMATSSLCGGAGWWLRHDTRANLAIFPTLPLLITSPNYLNFRVLHCPLSPSPTFLFGIFENFWHFSSVSPLAHKTRIFLHFLHLFCSSQRGTAGTSRECSRIHKGISTDFGGTVCMPPLKDPARPSLSPPLVTMAFSSSAVHPTRWWRRCHRGGSKKTDPLSG